MNFLNLLKYEIIIKYKRALLFICLLAAWMVYLFTRINVWPNGGAAAMAVVTSVGIFVVILIDGIKILSRELKDDTGYMLYSLPVGGYSIVGAKVIALILEFILYTVFYGIALWLILTSAINSDNLGGAFYHNNNLFNRFIFSNFQYLLYFYINALILIIGITLLAYLSMLVARMFLYKRKYEKLASIGIFFGLAYVINKVISVFTNNLKLDRTNMNNALMNVSGLKIQLQSSLIEAGIIEIIVSIIFAVGLFLLTSYIAENYLDL